MIEKRSAQVVSIQGKEVQLMDMETFEMFNLEITALINGDQLKQCFGSAKTTREIEPQGETPTFEELK
jgi:translation elongation factor P/translation initiation factor 5A